mmetsp:Transcript_41186/g.106558  ORF Transcript_41186/g.106558 Transcript_41186/m.106558 type:complete len:242 (-) Transcript_41186:1865-2590(-)
MHSHLHVLKSQLRFLSCSRTFWFAGCAKWDAFKACIAAVRPGMVRCTEEFLDSWHRVKHSLLCDDFTNASSSTSHSALSAGSSARVRASDLSGWPVPEHTALMPLMLLSPASSRIATRVSLLRLRVTRSFSMYSSAKTSASTTTPRPSESWSCTRLIFTCATVAMADRSASENCDRRAGSSITALVHSWNSMAKKTPCCFQRPKLQQHSYPKEPSFCAVPLAPTTPGQPHCDVQAQPWRDT